MLALVGDRNDARRGVVRDPSRGAGLGGLETLRPSSPGEEGCEILRRFAGVDSIGWLSSGYIVLLCWICLGAIIRPRCRHGA